MQIQTRPTAAFHRQELSQNFALEEGGQQHFFSLGPDESESQLVVRPDSRVIAAFPSDNTGISVWFDKGANVTAIRPPRSHRPWFGQELEVYLHSHSGNLVISEAILGSIRTIREELHGTGEVDRIRRDSAEWARIYGSPSSWIKEQATLGKEGDETELSFVRTELDGRPYQAQVFFPPEVSVRKKGDGWEIQAPGPFDFRLRARLPKEPLGGYTPPELFSGKALEQLDRLSEQGDPRADRCLSSMRGLMFLARKKKFMAGSWRFMTYFGRDTMLSQMLLQPAITPRAYAEGLQSVVDRLSPEGVVAHEEDLGPWAEQHRIHQALGNVPAAAAMQALSEPIYDYKMVDDDFLLPLSTARMPREERAEFLAQISSNGESNLTRLARNWRRVLEEAAPYANDPRWQNLIKINEGMNVGDWRDSEEGLGWGKYPGSVNVDLVATSVRAIRTMVAELPPDQRPELPSIGDAWEGANEHFRVRLDAGQVRDRLQKFFAGGTLTPAETAFYLSQQVEEGGPTLGEFLGGAPGLKDGLSFMALSLDGNGKKIEIPNSDASFRLFLGDPPRQEVEDMLRLLELPYPVGLMTSVGPVVANAAYSDNPVHHKELNRQGYHGAVIWSWQSAMLQAGLARQRDLHPELADRLNAAIDRLQAAEAKAGPLATSELWTHEVVDGEQRATAWGGQDAQGGDESNAAQLWSTVYPAVLMRTSDKKG